MSLKYVQEHNQPPHTKLNLPKNELRVKRGELFRGNTPTGIVLKDDHTVRNLALGAVFVAAAGVFAYRYFAQSKSASKIKIKLVSKVRAKARSVKRKLS